VIPVIGSMDGPMRVDNFRLLLNNTPVEFVKSPNVDDLLQETTFVIMHYTGGPSLASAVNWLAKPASKVSAHLVIGRNGDVVQLVPFNYCAWHAGVSQWKGYSGLNRFSIGIELDNAGMMKRSGTRWISSFGKLYSNAEVLAAAHKSSPNAIYGWQKYTKIQLKTATEVVAALVRAYGIREILGHDDIAPKRKKDPGPAFPMEQFRLDVAALVAAAGPTDNTAGKENTTSENGGPSPQVVAI
jgi:N-acetylmuramoyl-L-alanine amidase